MAENVTVVGSVPHDDPDRDWPIKIGGKSSFSSPAVVTTGDRVDALFSLVGGLAIAAQAASTADGVASPVSPGALSGAASHPLAGVLFNGTTYDRVRSNVEGTALASAARTATTNSADIVNYNGRGILVMLDVSAASGTGGLTLYIGYKDPVSGIYQYLLQAPAAVTAISTKTYASYPGAPNSTAVQDITRSNGVAIPRTLRILVSHGDASSYTYSVGYTLIV